MDSIDHQEVRRYFEKQFESSVELVNVKRSFPGVSRETWLIDALIADQPTGLILRIDPPEGSSVPTSMRREYEIYRRLFKSEIPVPEALWYDEGIDFLNGRPHMVRRMVEGRTSVPGLMDKTAAGADLRRAVARECMAKLVLLHTFDWKAHGLDEVMDVPSDPASALPATIAEWRGRWKATRPDHDPVMEEALAWLAENCPTDTPRVSLVKGNNGIGEEIWAGTKIIAMCDWEMAELGDGVLDLFFSQGTMSLNGFDETLKYYEEYLGERVSEERLAFGFFMIALKRLVGLRCGIFGSFVEGKTDKLFSLSLGYIYASASYRDLSRVIGKDIVEAYCLTSRRDSRQAGEEYHGGLGGEGK